MSHLPFPRVILGQHSATLGKTGAGKSSALRVINEDLLTQNKRTCTIDPKGDWWGLKASANGKSAGYPVITFGDFKNDVAGDVPINEASGKHVAELIATGNRPCVIGFRGWMPGKMVKFWLDFRAIGKTEVNLAWLAASLATTCRARGFEENLRTVRAAGYVMTGNSRAELTSEGLAITGEAQAPADFPERICEMLSGPQAQLFRELKPGTEYTLDDLAEFFGTTVRARGFEENIRFLRSNELITVTGGVARRAEWIPA